MVCLAKNSGVTRLLVISQVVALAPFSQNSKTRGSAGLAQAQLTHMKPSGLFCLSRTGGAVNGTRSRPMLAANERTDPQPPAAASYGLTSRSGASLRVRVIGRS